MPLLDLQDLTLNRVGDRHGDNIGEPIQFQMLDKLNRIKPTVAQDSGDVKAGSKCNTGLMKKTHCTLPGTAVPGAVPYVDYIART